MLKVLAAIALASSLSATSDIYSQLSLRHTEPRGVGFYQGYTTFEGFLLYSPPAIDSFINVRGHIFNDGRPACNAGLGFRKEHQERFWGFNSYYDFRKVPHKNFNQLSLGFESLGKMWDFFTNGYIILGSSKSHPYRAKFAKFQGNQLFIKQSVQEAFSGADLFARVHLIRKCSWDFSLDFGPYYFTSKHTKNLVGGSISLSANLTDYVFATANTSYDRVFKWLGQGTLGVSIPLGTKKKSCPPCQPNCGQLPMHRDIIVVNKYKKVTPAINPATGDPYTFWFVNNTSSSSGSFESPFHDLISAQNASSPNDAIYLFQGDGTTTNMDQGITLQNEQQLLGSGILQTISTTFGQITIPQLTSGYPVITNVNFGDPGVILANNNTISGIHIDSPDGEGIFGLGAANVTIINSIISHINTGNNAGDYFAIDLEGQGFNGTHLIAANTILQTASDNPASAIFLQPGNSTGPEPDICTMNVYGNQITTTGYGVQLTDSDGTFNLNISDNVILVTPLSTKQGINLQPKTNSQMTTLIQNNVVTQTNGVALGIQPRDQANITATILNNQLINSHTGVKIQNGGSTGVVLSTLIGNQFSNNSVNDLIGQVSTGKQNQLCFDLQDNYAPNLGYEFDVGASPTGTINLTVFENNVGPLSISGNVTQNPTCP